MTIDNYNVLVINIGELWFATIFNGTIPLETTPSYVCEKHAKQAAISIIQKSQGRADYNIDWYFSKKFVYEEQFPKNKNIDDSYLKEYNLYYESNGDKFIRVPAGDIISALKIVNDVYGSTITILSISQVS